MLDFNFGSSVSSLRNLRERMEKTLPATPTALWDYPVLREKCGCGASTEIESFDSSRAESHFTKWRKDHGCTIRKTK